MKETLIIQVIAAKANLSDMIQTVADQTGDADPFFCPRVAEGKPYEGHAHTFPPFGAINVSNEPIILK